MTTVYVVQEMPNHDITAALKFGDVQILLPANMQIAFSTAPAIRRIRRKLQNFQKGDYLLLTGDPVAIGMTCAIAAFYNAGNYSVLKWDRRERMYIPIAIDVTDNGESDD
tara:strand:- start:2995 stop:3324 length:330 start_codon:yes stop_codon:yes gene_type:complete